MNRMTSFHFDLILDTCSSQVNRYIDNVTQVKLPSINRLTFLLFYTQHASINKRENLFITKRFDSRQTQIKIQSNCE